MSQEDLVPSNFDGSVRLFPLPNVVLLPGVMLPLHIFEPRYRQMTADALATDRLIAMVLSKSGPGEQHLEPAAIHSIACLGKVIAEQRLEDGRYHILLRGLSRARILSEISHAKLYRSARVELLGDTGAPAAEQARAYRASFSAPVTAWFKALGVASDQLVKLLHSDLPLGALVDILGFWLPVGVDFKQQLLEEIHVERRARHLLHYLQTHDPPSKPVGLPNQFPPEFSAN
jgi:Lon protease-like protein